MVIISPGVITVCICENKGAGQLRIYYVADQCLLFSLNRYIPVMDR